MDNEGDQHLKKTEINKTFLSLLSSPPTLQSIAAVSIVIKLWTESEMIEDLKKPTIHYSCFEDKCSFTRSEDKVIMKLNGSRLPLAYKNTIHDFIRPVGFQMIRWFQTLDSWRKESCSLRELNQVRCSIYWTMHGTIDRIKSLEERIKDNDPEKDYDHLYKLACKYCLEDYIFYLWERIPYEKKCAYAYIYEYIHKDDVLVAYWTFTLRNEWHVMSEKIDKNVFFFESIPDCNTFENMIFWSISTGNLYAFKYFWQKLTEAEKSDRIVAIWLYHLVAEMSTKLSKYAHLESVSYSYILWILLTHLKDGEMQEDFFKNHSEIILRTLLQCWPFQRFYKSAFLELLKLDYISEHTYLTRMFDLAEDIVKTKSAEFFAEVWSNSPQNLKQRFLKNNLERNYHVRVMLYILKIADFKTLSLLLKDAPARENKGVAYVVTTSEYLQNYIDSKKDLSLVDNLLKEVMSPNRNFQSFKRGLVSLHYDHGYEDMCLKWVREGDLEALGKFLNWAFPTLGEIEKFKKEKLPFIDTYILLICKGNYDNISRFVKWYFEKEEEIPQIKNIFFQKDNDSNLEKLIHELACQKERSFDLFQKFLNIVRFSPEETIEFKRMCFCHIDDLVRGQHLRFATVLLIWCYDNAEEMDRYQSKLVLSILGLKICPPYDYAMLSKMIRSFITSNKLMAWSLPLSKEVIAEVKLSLSRNEHFQGEDLRSVIRKRNILFRLLDCKCIAEIENISKKYRLS